MISKGIVYIETFDSSGTGFIVPCKNACCENSSYNYYMVITAGHILSSYNVEEDCTSRIENDVIFVMYDDFGNQLNKDDYNIIDYYYNAYEINPENDVSVFLIEIKKQISIYSINQINTEKLENRSELFTEGYPGILLGDKINKRIRLKTMEKEIFPYNSKIGAYQITDDYHWYNNYEDKKLLEGLSGSPVFSVINGKEMLVGMNQSIAPLEFTKNPFKIVYYIKFQHILNILRVNGVVIYQKENTNKYEIIWINKKRFDKYSDSTFLVIGSSGAGKSSFIHSFAYHSDYIKSTNDGQTTRTPVKYSFSLNKSELTADIVFFEKEMFANNNLKHAGIKLLNRILCCALDLNYSFYSDDKSIIIALTDFLDDYYSIKNKIEGKDEKAEKEIKKETINNFLIDELDIINTCELYNKIINAYLKISVPIQFLSFLIESEEIDSLYLNDRKFEGDYLSSEMVEKINKVINDRYPKSHKEIRNILLKEYLNKKNSISNYSIFSDNLKRNKEILLNELNNINGFFHINEFVKLDLIDPVYSGELFCQTEKDTNEFKIDDMVKGYYSSIYDHITQNWAEKYKQYYVTNKGERKYNIEFVGEKSEKIKILTSALQADVNGSISSIVEYIKINDMISDYYSTIMNELSIKTIHMIDTFGFDHIANIPQKAIKRTISDLYNSEIINEEATDLISIIYVKKLDSGKPDELKSFLPAIKESIPRAAIYCLFSGIDIFYRDKLEVESICWKYEDVRIPKSVNYILSEEGKKDCGVNDNQTEPLYNVLKNNIIPFCGKKELIDTKYYFYRNNYKYIKQMFTSVAIKEYSSLDIINEEVYVNDDVKKKLGNFVELVFKYASLTNTPLGIYKQSYIHHATEKADIRRIYHNKELGANLTYDHVFYSRFNFGYGRACDHIDTYNNFKGTKLLGVLRNMQPLLFGERNNLFKVNFDKKTKFREALDKLYEDNHIELEKVNDIEVYVKSLVLPDKREESFDKIFNFYSLLKNTDGGIDSMTEVFNEALKQQVTNDNNQKSKNLILLSEKLKSELENAKAEFVYKYGNQDDESEKQFYLMLKYYCDSKLKND